MPPNSGLYLLICLLAALHGCIPTPPGTTDEVTEVHDFSNSSLFRYALTATSGPPAKMVVSNLEIERGDNAQYTLRFATSDGQGGTVPAPERLLTPDEGDRTLALFAHITIITRKPPDICAAADMAPFYQPVTWDGQSFFSPNICLPTHIRDEDWSALRSVLEDLIGPSAMLLSATN